MDPLTHTLTGAVLAEAGLARRTPLAMPTLLIGANLPDLDAFAYLVSGDAALGFRRGWTHGVLAWMVLPALLAGAMMLYDRRWRRRLQPTARTADGRRILAIAGLAVATHPLLDWLNTYGIRLLMPFEGRWFYGDTLFIIDPWLWLVLGGCVFLAHSRSRRGLAAWGALALVTTAIFLFGSASLGARVVWFAGLALLALLRRRQLPVPRYDPIRLARITLAAAIFYVSLLHTGSVLARHDVQTQLESLGVTAHDIMVGPVPIRPLAHVVVVDSGPEIRLGSYDWFATPRFQLEPDGLSEVPDEAKVAAALEAPCLQGMVSWVRYPWVEIERDDAGNGWMIYLMDARYTRSRTASFGGSAVRLDRDLAPVCKIDE